MAWFWKPDSDVDHTGLDKTFASQGEAENWLGEFYPDLLDAGVRAVTLFEEDRLVYGPMNLSPDV